MVKTLPFNTEGTCSIPGQGAEIPHALLAKKKKNKTIRQKQYCNKFNKDFKNGSNQKILKKKKKKKERERNLDGHTHSKTM